MENMNWNYPTPIWFGLNRVSEIQNACNNLNISNPLIQIFQTGMSLTLQVCMLCLKVHPILIRIYQTGMCRV